MAESRMHLSSYPSPRQGWVVVAILIATAILSYTDRQVLSLLVDPMRAGLHISDTQVSLLLGTAFALVYGVAGLPLGYLADRMSRRNLIFAGVVVWSIGTIACGLSQSFAQVFASRIVVGLGEAVLSPAAISIISDYFPPARRGTAVGFFLSGIAIGSGVSILIGGGVLRLVESGLLAGTALGHQEAWRLVLLVIGAPGLVWCFCILLIAEPVRRAASPPAASIQGAVRRTAWAPAAPVYLVVALASFVDNATGAWAPTLLIRGFHMDPAQVGLQLGLLLTLGFGGGVMAGGALADRAAVRGGLSGKLSVSLAAAVAVLPVAFAIDVPSLTLVMIAVPVYFALSGIVTAVGFSVILDLVPGRSRALAMSISFFLNVAFGAGLGPTAVAAAGTLLFPPAAGLGPPIALTAGCGYLLVSLTLGFMLLRPKARMV
jgi:MFS family permease